MDGPLAQNMVNLAAGLGVPLSGELSRRAAVIDARLPIRPLAIQLGELVRRQNIFRRPDGSVLTVNPETGEEKPMTAKRFSGWVEEFCAIKNAPGGRESLLPDIAATILETDAFLDQLWPLTRVNLLRLPVQRRSGEIELLPVGYDRESAIFTVDLVPYAQDWSLETSKQWFIEVLHEFDWNGLEESTSEERIELLPENRSFAVFMTGAVGSFCRSLFTPGTTRPMIAILANKPGPGKTILAQVMFAPVDTRVGTQAAPKDEDKLELKLDTAARSHREVVIFDNVKSTALFQSQALERFLTDTIHEGRPYHTNSVVFSEPNVTQLVVTANELYSSEDLGRRVLQIELFSTQDVRTKKLKRIITPEWLREPDIRAKFLSASWGILRNWIENDGPGGPMPMHPRPLQSFERWTQLVCGAVVLAGFTDPLQEPERVIGGAPDKDVARDLVISVVEPRKQPAGEIVVTTQELAAAAREQGILLRYVGSSDDPVTGKALSNFGRLLARWRGHPLTLPGGQCFRFGNKKAEHSNGSAIYRCPFL